MDDTTHTEQLVQLSEALIHNLSELDTVMKRLDTSITNLGQIVRPITQTPPQNVVQVQSIDQLKEVFTRHLGR